MTFQFRGGACTPNILFVLLNCKSLMRSSSRVSLDPKDLFAFHVAFGMLTGWVFIFHMQSLERGILRHIG
jgi:hypothetical protein